MATSAPVQFVVVSALLEGSPTHVDRLELVEALDEPYAAELWLRIHDTSIDVVALLGEDLVVTMQRGDQERRICGLVRSVSEGAPNPEHLTARIDLRPALWALSLRRNTRMFQAMSVPQIVEQVSPRRWATMAARFGWISPARIRPGSTA